MVAKIQKLEAQFSLGKGDSSSCESSIFNGISIFVNGYTGKRLNEA